MRRRLIATSLLLVLATLVAFAVPLGVAVRSLLESRALDELQAAVEQLALVLDVTARDCGELQLRLAQVGAGMAGRPDATVLTLIASGGVVLTTTDPEGRPVIGDELRAAGSGRSGRRADEGRLAIASPLSTDVCARPVVLHASQPDTALRASVLQAWLAIAGLAVAVAVAAALSARWLGRQLAAPFEALTVSARRLGEGDFSARAPRSDLPEADAIADALDGTAARLGRAVARSTAFTADASHQLRTPLTALRLHLESLAAEGRNEDAIASALEEADRLEATIDDLAVLTRVDAPEVDVDLGALVRERLPAWRTLAGERGRELVEEILPVPVVRVRPAAVLQAVQVLLDNALEHGVGTVTVRVGPALPDEPETAVRISVTDEGPGTGTVVRRAGGRGLPLARALVGAEGGRLVIDAEPTGGTRACLLLPGSGDHR